MAIFNCYVSSPEGITILTGNITDVFMEHLSKPQNRWIAGRNIFPWSRALFPAVPGPDR